MDVPCPVSVLACGGTVASVWHTSAQGAAGRESQSVGPYPNQLGIFLRSFQNHDSPIWMPALVEQGPLGACNQTASRAESLSQWLLEGADSQMKQVGPWFYCGLVNFLEKMDRL